MYQPMFVPPRETPLVVGLANAVLPALAQMMFNLRDVQVPDADLALLEGLGPGRAILTPNHPTGQDPVVMMWLSRLTGHRFNYLAAREVFVGWRGWCMNHVGAYSVIRGVPDRESLKFTRRLLGELDRKVVIFPEGEIYEYNDTLLAFQSGVPQIGFWVLDDLAKAGKPLSMPIVPVAIKYRCCDSFRHAIENSLRDLERALDLEPDAKLSAYARLLRIGDRVLASIERDHGLKPEEGGPLQPRITAMRRRMLCRVAEAVGAEVNHDAPPAEQLHQLFNALKAWVGELPPDGSEYDERLYRRRMEVAAPLFRDLHRFQNFIAVSGDYVASQATAERFLEVLGRLEKEVLGGIRNTVAREALVRVGAPIRLEERYEAYRANKRQVVRAVTQEMEGTIRSLLQELSRESTPIAIDT